MKIYIRRGFTLIELLVVISIIALLMSILMPSLGKARNMAKAVVCKSNLKQWGVINLMYTEDNNGRFSEGRLGWGERSWVWTLRPYYMDQGDIRFCPMATKPRGTYEAFSLQEVKFSAWGPYPDPRGDATESGSYGFNNWLYDIPADETSGWYPGENYWRTTNVDGASNIPVMMDCCTRGSSPRYGSPAPGPNEENVNFYGYPGELGRFCINRHNGYVNSVFLDWSVRSVGLKELWRLKWHRNFDTGYGYYGDWPEWMKSFKNY